MNKNDVKLFLTPKSVLLFLFLIALVTLSWIQLLNFKQRLDYHKHDYVKTRTYYDSQICQDPSLKSKTEGKNTCDHYAVLLSTEPWERALQDTLYDFYPYLKNIGFALIGMILLLVVFFVSHTKKAIEKAREIRMGLPTIFEDDYKQKKSF